MSDARKHPAALVQAHHVAAIEQRIYNRLTNWRNHILQVVCGVRGHQYLHAVSGTRMFLRCSTCQHETAGWTTASRPPRERFEGDAARHRLRS